MMRYLRLAGLQLRTSAAAGMTYRADFLLEGVMALVWTGLTLLPLLVLFEGRETVAGWGFPGSLIVIAFFAAMRAVMDGLISPSILDLVERIRSGAFDYVLLKPVDAQALVSTSRCEPWKLFDILLVLVMIVYAFVELGEPPAVQDVLLGATLFLAGLIAAYSLWLGCAAAAFWVVRLDNLAFLLGAIFDVARWPVQVFRGAWRFVFTFIIPVAVMTTYPAEAMLGTLDAQTAVAAIAGALALFGLSRLLWRLAIRNYTSASS